jgi:hypothetical protein
MFSSPLLEASQFGGVVGSVFTVRSQFIGPDP